ncbi:MAG TPA: response regulator transcription factor [Ideonella sp.]|uniref:response regulator transcription factor n=1 Tax=Ideonella sp. TaxID=1929293 RepID=UPI002C646A4F|nr:response regulator transcription factor [Ideonella sp.]HSI50574.1 response regulator transcription factor [Ideonella sp.]
MTAEAPRPAEPPPPIRVLTVDDHALLREGIASMLAQQPDLQVVAEAGNGREAVEAFRQHRPDVTLMDLQMPLMGGVEATLAIRAEWPQARIVALTTYKGDVQIRRALQAGVSGYLLKSMLRKELVDGIRQVHAGRRLVPPEIATELAEHLLDEALSPRETEVLRLVAQGGSNKRVAGLLAVTEDTVKAHMKGILAKLGAVDRTHAVTIALRRGIIEL